MLWIIFILILVLFAVFDLHYFLRGFLYTFLLKLRLKISGRKNILDEVTTEDFCSTTDLDFLWHMNNGRYLRQCDFGRYNLWISNGVYQTVSDLKGFITLGASMIRYRKSIELGDRFQIKTRVVAWDDRAFYVEQRTVRKSDGFICAIMMVKQSLVRVSPDAVVAKLVGSPMKSPELPEEVALWIKANQISSEKLKKSN